ncbi:hypothetical protein [Archangium sp.]|uniref:hypothetical protein n=1 Tax=Archangium sp. TaxID=1872627 RepID=UPI00389A4EB7
MKAMSQYFYMRPGFERFQLEPEANRKIVIGERDRRFRDDLLNAIEEGSYGLEGYTAVIYGDYGRGKTHEAHNIMYEVQERKLPVQVVYVKCHEFKAKEPFSSVFTQLLLQIGVESIRRVANEYHLRAENHQVPPLREVLGSDELAAAFQGLTLANLDLVRQTLRWLGGEKGIDTEKIAKGLSPQLTVSRDFAAVIKGLAHMIKEVDKKVLIFLIDEAEQFKQVKHPDTYWSWVGCIRALTETLAVGYVFYVGANSRDDLPELFLWDEIRTRIGAQNYRDLLNPGPDELRNWVKELFHTLIRKGPVPLPHRKALAPGALDETVPSELKALTTGNPAALESYPFTPEALDEFINQCMSETLANRPREVLKRIQSAAKRTMRHDKPQIDTDILAELQSDII